MEWKDPPLPLGCNDKLSCPFLKLCIYFSDHFVLMGSCTPVIQWPGWAVGRERGACCRAHVFYFHICCHVKIPPKWAKDFFSLKSKKEWKQTKKLKWKPTTMLSTPPAPIHLWFTVKEVVGEEPTLPQGRRGFQSKLDQSLSEPHQSCAIDHWP